MNLQRYSLFQTGCFLLLGIGLSGCGSTEDQASSDPTSHITSHVSSQLASDALSEDSAERVFEAKETIHFDPSNESNTPQLKSESQSASPLFSLERNASSDLNTALFSSAREESEESLDLEDLFEPTPEDQIENPAEDSGSASPKLKSESKKMPEYKPRLADKGKSLPAGASKSWKSLNKYKEISNRFESSLREFLDTEKTYSKSLETLSDFQVYLQKKTEDPSFKVFHDEYQALSEKLDDLKLFEFYFYSSGFMVDLERLLKEEEKNRALHERAGEFCTVLNTLCIQLRDHYSSYLRGQSQLQDWINHFHKQITHKHFKQKFSPVFWADGNIGGGINELQSLAMAVAQRVPRYKLLIEAAMKLGSELEAPAELACFESLRQSFDDLLKQAIQVLPANLTGK